MVKAKRRRAMQWRRLFASVLIVLMTLSAITRAAPIGSDVTAGQSAESKIDSSLLDRTESEETLDLLVTYDNAASEFKARNAIALYDRSAEIVDTYDELNMIRVKLIGKAISQLAEEEFITGIWSNEVQEIAQPQSLSASSFTSEEYESPVNTTGARALWDRGYNGTGVVIAVLDTGVDTSHEDVNKVNAYASFVEADTLPTDIIGHGTYAASIAAGTGNMSDGLYAGIAPGATLLSAKVTLGGLFAAPSWIVSGIEWACSRGADIILLPFNTFGAPGDTVTMAVQEATEKGVLVVAAAGDDGPDYMTVMSPGGAAESLTVGAYDTKKKEIPDFSGRGPSLSLLTKPDLVAPGVGIVGAKLGAGLAGLGFGDLDLGGLGDISGLFGGGSLGETVDENYTVSDTTTASAAIVAGAAAILMQAFDRATPLVLSNVLRDTATAIGYGANDGGAGLLNLLASFEYLASKQTPIKPHNRTTGTPLLALGIVTASGTDASTVLLMSSFGTTIAGLDTRAGQESSLHIMMGMFALRWGNRSPTDLMEFAVKSEMHQVAIGVGGFGYSRYIGVLSFDDQLYTTLVVESYNLTDYSEQPLTAFRVTPYILNLGQAPVGNVSLFLSYSGLDIYGDGRDDHGKYDLSDQELFVYGINENLDSFYFGVNSSIPLDAFEVGNSSEISSHVSDDNLTGSTTHDGSVGLAMKWDFGVLHVNQPVNVTIAMGFGENRTVLDTSIDAMWELDPNSTGAPENDLIIVEAEMPRIAEMGQTYESRAVVMNVGWNISDITAAMLIIHGEDDGDSLYGRVFSYDGVEPFQAQVMTAEWSPEKMGISTIYWVTAGNIDDALSLSTGSLLSPSLDLSAILALLDDFIMRDLFVVTPIPSTSVFPKQTPFAPFDIRFPADFGLYTFLVSSNVPLGNLTVRKHGNASDWGNVTLQSIDSVEGYYSFSLFLLAPPIMMDGYHRCDYVIETEHGWTSNITLQRVIEYPRAMLLLDTSHGGGLSFMGGLGGDFGGGFEGDVGGIPFALAQDPDDAPILEGGFNLGDLSDLGSLTDLLEAFRMTTFSGLSELKKSMAARGLDLVETPGMPLDRDLLIQFSGVLIFSPTEEFNSTDAEILSDYTADGGKLIVFGNNDDHANLTVLNQLLAPYGYSMQGKHTEENTTDIVTSSLLGAGLDSIWLGGGTYILENQSLASAFLDGKPVVLLDQSRPELALFGSSRMFMNKNLVKNNNSMLLDNLNEYLLLNTLTGVASLSENTTRYQTGLSVFLNLYVTDYDGQPVNDLFVAIVFELPNGSLAFFIAGFVEDGLYSSQFVPSYWNSSGRINGIFIILGGEDYATTYASVTFELFEPDITTTTTTDGFPLTMAQIALISTVSVFSGLVIGLLLYRSRRRKRMRIIEIDAELVREIDNTLNTLLAAFTQIEDLIQREDLDRIQKIEALRGLMDTLEQGGKMFDRISDKVGGV
ncbi:MAG: S8 family serine peptidase [Candidatus Thorarchaeota archaeon]